MHILLTNDDGISALGLQALYQTLSENEEVVVVAPDQEKSATGHGITLHHPIRVTERLLTNGKIGYAVSGTPVDCIKLAFLEILNKKPDIVISGINRGANLGVNINYSGTAAAAREAALYRIPAIAVSIQGQQEGYFHEAARYVSRLSSEILKKGIPPLTFLNVNFPAMPLSKIAGVRVCRHGLSFPAEYLDRRKDPRGKIYYWHGCDFKNMEDDLSIDSAAVDKAFISISPIKCDLTDYKMIDELESWDSLNDPVTKGV